MFSVAAVVFVAAAGCFLYCLCFAVVIFVVIVTVIVTSGDVAVFGGGNHCCYCKNSLFVCLFAPSSVAVVAIVAIVDGSVADGVAVAATVAEVTCYLLLVSAGIGSIVQLTNH